MDTLPLNSCEVFYQIVNSVQSLLLKEVDIFIEFRNMLQNKTKNKLGLGND